MTYDTIYRALSVVIALSFSAVFSMHFFYEGTSIGKYVAKQSEMERVKEADVTHYTDMVLFGDEMESVSEDVDLTAAGDSEAGFEQSQRIRRVDKAINLLMLAGAWAMLIPALWNRRAFSWVYLVLGVYLLLLSLCKGLNGGTAFSELAIPAHATRWLPCLVLWLWLLGKPGQNAEEEEEKQTEEQVGGGVVTVTTWGLVLSVSLTFGVHGYEAVQLNPFFVDLLYGAFERLSIPLSETGCHTLLRGIGVMDMCLALLVLVFRWKFLFVWMAIWGGLTALSRPFAFGHILWEDSLLRVGNCLLPLALLAVIILQQRFNTENEDTISS